VNKIAPSDLRRLAAAMIREGSMPSLDAVLQAAADVREEYAQQIKRVAELKVRLGARI